MLRCRLASSGGITPVDTASLAGEPKEPRHPDRGQIRLDQNRAVAYKEGVCLWSMCLRHRRWRPSRCSPQQESVVRSQEPGHSPLPKRENTSLSVRRSRAVINQHYGRALRGDYYWDSPHPSRQVGTPSPHACAEASACRARSPTLQSSGDGAGRGLLANDSHARGRGWRPVPGGKTRWRDRNWAARGVKRKPT